MATEKIDAISLSSQPKTGFAKLKGDMNLTVGVKTTLTLKLNKLEGGGFEIELIPEE